MVIKGLDPVIPVVVVTVLLAGKARFVIVPSLEIVNTLLSVAVVRLVGPEPILSASTFTSAVESDSAEATPVPSSITFREPVSAAASVVFSSP